MNCDRFAAFYQIVETLGFGQRLQRCRTLQLKLAEGKRRALVLGDGDGRFTAELLRRNPRLSVDSVELSQGMITQAAKHGVSLIQGDAFTYLFRQEYDVVFTHFFLDCFSSPEVRALAERVTTALSLDATWVVSEFRQAKSGWRKWYCGLWLKVMYAFFGLTTGLRTQTLPDYQTALVDAGFVKVQEDVSWDGLIASQVWQKSLAN